MRAAPDVSFTEMVRLQEEAQEGSAEDPRVSNAVSVAGVGAANLTPNTATLVVTLLPHAERRRKAGQIALEMDRALEAVPGISAFVKPVQDVQIATRASWSQYQYTLVAPDTSTVREWGAKLLG